MLTVEVKCSSCQSNRVIKFRLNSKGKQRDQCRNKDCAKDPFILDYENQGYLPAITGLSHQNLQDSIESKTVAHRDVSIDHRSLFV